MRPRVGCEAERFGWAAMELFGVHPLAPDAGYDGMGLVPLMRGGDNAAVHLMHATVRMPSGGLLTYLRRIGPGAVALWELAPSK
jgi:hypothetical protein